MTLFGYDADNRERGTAIQIKRILVGYTFSFWWPAPNGVRVFNEGPAVGPVTAHIFVANMAEVTVGTAARFKHSNIYRT